jgi:hypothetical protein
MPNRKLLAVCILIAVAAAIVPGRAARSDAAPPREPPAGNVWPAAGTTMVQMTAENVTLWIRPASGRGYVAAVTADFNFRNQGTAAESMQVRFPMEPVNGGGDGYGGRPLIRNFAAKTGGAALPITTVEEPFEDGPAVAWSTFPVTFPAGKDVFLRVTYETGFSSGHYGDSWLDYILETGAGWYGNIGSAVVTYRFPYAVGPLNVPVQEQAVRTGSEVRFLFSEFEPDFLSNIRLEFLHPAVWQKVLDLEHATGENPKDVRSVVQLAAEYQDLCMLAGTDASLLAETIVLADLQPGIRRPARRVGQYFPGPAAPDVQRIRPQRNPRRVAARIESGAQPGSRKRAGVGSATSTRRKFSGTAGNSRTRPGDGRCGDENAHRSKNKNGNRHAVPRYQNGDGIRNPDRGSFAARTGAVRGNPGRMADRRRDRRSRARVDRPIVVEAAGDGKIIDRIYKIFNRIDRFFIFINSRLEILSILTKSCKSPSPGG